MKKLLLIPVLLFVVFTKTFAQDCKWEENKKDPISDTKYLKSKKNSSWIKGEKPSPGVLPYFKSYIELKDAKVTLWVHYEITSLLSLERIQNPKIIIKLADGTKIDITSTEEFATTLQPTVNTTMVDFKWAIANEDVKKIAASMVSAIRISFGGQDYSFIIENKPANEFLNMFGCMSKEL